MLANQALTDQQMQQAGHTPTQPAVEAMKPSMLDRVAEWAKDNRQKQPTLKSEFNAFMRAGREDVFNMLLKPFPDSPGMAREMGDPSTPTPQEVFKDGYPEMGR